MPKAMKKGEQRRAEILAIAREVLIDDGYDALVLREIAERAGVTLGNLQYYFPTRADLIVAIGLAENEHGLNQMLSIKAYEVSPEEKIRLVVEDLVRSWLGESGRIFITLMILGEHQPRLHEAYETIYREFYDSLSTLLAELNPTASQEWVAHKVRLATCLMDGSTLQPILTGQGEEKEQEEFLAELADEVLRVVTYEKPKPNR
jgi:AcrR family transcriptional regulator